MAQSGPVSPSAQGPLTGLNRTQDSCPDLSSLAFGTVGQAEQCPDSAPSHCPQTPRTPRPHPQALESPRPPPFTKAVPSEIAEDAFEW